MKLTAPKNNSEGKLLKKQHRYFFRKKGNLDFINWG